MADQQLKPISPGRVAAELRKQPKTPPNQLMQLLRPEPKAGARPVKRVG